MHANGPNGYWAFTTWYVRWSASCQVSLEIDYIMPRHVSPSAMPGGLRQRWNNMLAALERHERKHGAHGINAARELVAKKCRNGNAIVRKWARQDQILDQRTNHGLSEGVVFP